MNYEFLVLTPESLYQLSSWRPSFVHKSVLFELKQKFFLTLNGHMREYLLTKFGRAGRENIWLSVSSSQLIDEYIILHSITRSHSIVIRYPP